MRLGLPVLLAFVSAVGAQEKSEPLVAQVKTAIERGVKHMEQVQKPDGGWREQFPSYEGGCSGLVMLALLNAGAPLDSDVVKRGLAHVRKLEPDSTYARALQTLVLAEAGLPEDRARISANVKWLLEARVYEKSQFAGWSYHKFSTGGSDNSNSQYAMLGLWAGRQAGVKIDRDVWEAIREFYLRTQEADGSWPYSLATGRGGITGPSLTMTSAGLSGLLISGMELNVGREVLQPNGVAKNCGVYEENMPLAKALNWIGNHFTLDGNTLANRAFYNLYGLERTGRLTGQRFLGGHDWYREGCQYLVKEQLADGSWRGPGPWEQYDVVATSFALLFLSKGRTPVLMSKLVHGPALGRDIDTDWNNDRNDLRNLVAFSAENLFHKLPLAWQTFDALRAATPAGASITEDDLLRATSDLLQTPIAYMNGHLSPLNRFTSTEKNVLKRYIDNGGFILAEACCGSPRFDAGFKRLVAELWPDNELVPLPGDHPVWGSFFPVKPGDPYELWGLSVGCKTVLIYSPKDLSCQWESNNYKDGQGLTAFRLGANIVAYATGLEPPKPRLTPTDVASALDPGTVPRGYIKVAQIRHSVDWQPAPKAMRNLVDKMHKAAGLDVVLKTAEVSVNSPSIVDYKFMYMQGRREFHFDDEALKHLRFNLKNGGLFFADASCGSEAFDKAFRAFAKQLFPNETLTRVPVSDVLFSKELNGQALTEANIEARTESGGPMNKMAPFLEGIKIDERWVVLYSKYDIGCALERHQSLACRGYQPDSAFRVAGAALLYSLRP